MMAFKMNLIGIRTKWVTKLLMWAKVQSTGHARQKRGGIFSLLSRCCTPNKEYGIGKLRCWHMLEEVNCTVVDQQPIRDDMINSGYLAASIYKPVVNKLWVITTWIMSSMRNLYNYTWTIHTLSELLKYSEWLLMSSVCLACQNSSLRTSAFHFLLRRTVVCKFEEFATPWTVACQAPLSMGFSRQEYWNGKPFPSPGDLLDSGIELLSPAL